MTTPPNPIRLAADGMDLSNRFTSTTSVVASPTGGTITTIASLTLSQNVTVVSGIQLWGWCAFTVGTSGVTAKLDIRQTSSSGSVVATCGATTVVATNLWETGAQGLDAAPVTLPGGVYVLCLTIGSGAATSTVSAVQLAALIV